MAYRKNHQKVDVYQITTNRILEALDKGTIPWHRPWTATDGTIPLSVNSGKPYRGINLFLLGFSGFNSQWWATRDKWAEITGMELTGQRGYKKFWKNPDNTPRGVREKEFKNGTYAVYWIRRTRHEEDEDTGEDKVKSYVTLAYHYLYNADQVDGVPEKYRAPKTEIAGTFAEHREAEEILQDYLNREGSPKLTYGGDHAYWTEGADTIRIPVRESYESTAEFYSTALHECGHSTGAAKRLAREEVKRYGLDLHSRPKEELCAEMTSAMLLAIAGIDDERAFNNSASYIDGWRRKITEDHRLVVNAAAQAQHAADYILGIKYENGEGE